MKARRRSVLSVFVVFAVSAPIACVQIFGAQHVTIVNDDDGGGVTDGGGLRDGSNTNDGPNAGETGDDANIVPACDLGKPFGDKTLITTLDNSRDWTARLTADELTMFVESERSGGEVIYVAKRAKASDPFGALAPLTIEGDGGAYTAPTPTADGLGMILVGPSQQNSNNDLFETSRQNPTAPFAPPIAIGASTTDDERAPYLLPTLAVLYFTASQNDVTTPDIYRSVKSAGVWQPRTAVTELNTPGTETYPTVTPDDKTIYFGAVRDGTSVDIWVARRNQVSSPFSNITIVAELSTPENDVPMWVSADGCRLLYRHGFSGPGDPSNSFFTATRGK